MCFTSATLAPDGLMILPTVVTCSFIPCTKGETQASPIISLRFHTAIRYFLHTSFWYTTLTFSKCGLMRSICPRPTLVGMFLKPSSFSMHIACSTVNSSCPQIRCSFWTTFLSRVNSLIFYHFLHVCRKSRMSYLEVHVIFLCYSCYLCQCLLWMIAFLR